MLTATPASSRNAEGPRPSVSERKTELMNAPLPGQSRNESKQSINLMYCTTMHRMSDTHLRNSAAVEHATAGDLRRIENLRWVQKGRGNKENKKIVTRLYT